MAQVVGHLPSKCEALSQTLVLSKKIFLTPELGVVSHACDPSYVAGCR
jgi:hypothetical protein